MNASDLPYDLDTKSVQGALVFIESERTYYVVNQQLMKTHFKKKLNL